MLRGIYCGGYVRNFIVRRKCANSQHIRVCRAMFRTSIVNTDRTTTDRKLTSSIRDGPSLKDFLAAGVSSNVDIPSQEPIPYLPDIRGESQKGYLNLTLKITGHCYT